MENTTSATNSLFARCRRRPGRAPSVLALLASGLTLPVREASAQWPQPWAVTLPATEVSYTSARLNGIAHPGWGGSFAFEWGTSTAFGNWTSPNQMLPGTNAVPFSALLSGLTPNTTYYFCASHTGGDCDYRSFTTLPEAPQVSTLHAAAVSTNSAMLNGTVNPNAWSTTAWFQWGATTNYGNLTAVTPLGNGTTGLHTPLAGLTPSVTYHFRIVAMNDYGLVYGSDQSFTTLGSPLVSTLPATGVSATMAALNGTANPNGLPTTAWFQWGATTNYGNLTSMTDLGSGTTTLPLSAPLTGLTPGVTYHFRIAATNDYGPAYGSDQSFTTGSLAAPLILTSGSGFGVQSNAFGFIISWATNLPVVVEACTNPANHSWSPLMTNALTGGWSYFSDPQWANYPVRFYRVRWP